MTIVRRMRDDDVEAVAAITAAVFAQEGEDETTMAGMLAFAYRHCPAMSPRLGMVAEVDGRVVAKWQALDLTIRIGVARLRAAGVQGVLTTPEHRLGGHALEIARRALPETIEEGFAVLLGFARRGSMYAQLGAGVVAADSSLALDAWTLPRGPHPLRAMRASDEARLLARHDEPNARRWGSVVRTAELWPFAPRRSAIFLLGEEGYLGLRVRKNSVEIRVIGGDSPRFCEHALRAVRELAERHGRRRVEAKVPVDHPLIEAAKPYGARVSAELHQRGGTMARIADAEGLARALEPELDRRWRDAGHRELGIGVDVIVDGRTLTLWAGRDAPRVERVSLPVDGSELAQILFGYRSVASVLAGSDQPERARLLADARAMSWLDALLPTSVAFVWDADRW